MTDADDGERAKVAETTSPSQQTSTNIKESSEQRPRKRRWRIVGLGMLVFLLLLVVAIPWIVSIRAVSDRVISYASSTLRGEIRLEKLSATWLGPNRGGRRSGAGRLAPSTRRAPPFLP